MLLFSELKKVFLSQQPVEEKISPQLATTVLLVEIMRLDSELKEQEKKYLYNFIQQEYLLEKHEINELIELANTQLELSTDYHQFTHALNQQLTVSEKIRLVARLWEMAKADDHIDAHEEHVIRKLADLLHLRHSEFIQAKNLALRD